jgi:hypothetical protein
VLNTLTVKITDLTNVLNVMVIHKVLATIWKTMNTKKNIDGLYNVQNV